MLILQLFYSYIKHVCLFRRILRELVKNVYFLLSSIRFIIKDDSGEETRVVKKRD